MKRVEFTLRLVAEVPEDLALEDLRAELMEICILRGGDPRAILDCRWIVIEQLDVRRTGS